MTLQEICEASKDFILAGGEHAFDNYVVIQGRNEYKAKFILGPASGHKDIYIQSACERYVPLVYSIDPNYNQFDQWDIVEIFESRKDVQKFMTQEYLQGLKERNGNGMLCVMVETYVKSRTTDYECHDATLYYIDEQTGLIYKELFDYYHETRNTQGYDITAAHSKETYVGQDGEDYYKQLCGGVEALDKNYQETFLGSTLRGAFEILEYKITELGHL